MGDGSEFMWHMGKVGWASGGYGDQRSLHVTFLLPYNKLLQIHK